MATYRILNQQEIAARDKQNTLTEQRQALQAMPYENLNSDGSAFGLRAAVNATPSEPDKLETIRSRYETAVPYGDGNFAYFDENGAARIHNPRGLDLGDLPAAGRITSEMIGGTGSFLATMAATGNPFLAYPAAGIGATALGEGYDRSVRGITDAIDSRTTGQQAGSIGLNTFLNMLPIDKAMDAAKPVVKFGRDKVNAVAGAAQRQGLAPTLGQLSDSRIVQSAEALANRFFVTADAAGQRATEAIDSMRAPLQRFFDGFGGRATTTQAGVDVLNNGQQARELFYTAKEELYNKVDEFIPPSQMVDAPNTSNVFDDLLSGYDNAQLQKLFGSGMLSDMGEVFTSAGQLSYKDIKKLRTRIGKMIHEKKATTMPDILESDLKAVYSALTADMGTAASSIGDDAFRAWQNADSFYKEGVALFDNVIDPVTRNADGSQLTGDEVFKRIQAMIKSDPSKLENVIESGIYSDKVSAAALSDLGEATAANQNPVGDALSPQRVINQTSKNAINPDSLELITNGTQKEIIEDLRTFAASVRDVTGKENFSNTASTSALQTALVGTGAAAADLMLTGNINTAAKGAGTLLVTYLAGRGFTSKALRDWAMKQPVQGSASEIKAWVKQGGNIAAANGIENAYNAIFNPDSDGQGVLAE